MTLSTRNNNKPTPAEKEAKLKAHRLYHEALIKELDINEKDFNVKLVFTNAGKRVVGIFPSEFIKDKGFYLEFVDTFLNPTDSERKVYKLGPRQNYEDIYPLLQTGAFAVPIEDLELVNTVRKAVKFIPETDINLNELKDDLGYEDEQFSKMSIRDIAAILWQAPVSNKKWLNNLINEHREQNL
jgi:hypothetical protein